MRPLLAAIGLGLSSVAAPAQVWFNASTSQFTSLALNTPTPVNFLGSGDLTMTRTSAIGSPILTDTWNGTFTTPVGGQPNPAWVLGTRSYFDLEAPSPGSAGSTVSYQFEFANGLATTSQLVFIDFDALERVTIKAFDASNNTIPFADTAILLSPGGDSTPRYQDISWAASAGATGLLANIFDDSESNIIASISSNTTIHRLVYEFDFSQVTSTATLRFQLAANPTTLYWLGSNGTLWSAGNNWSNNSTGDSPTDFEPGYDIIFSADNSSNSTDTNLGGDLSIASLTINSTAGISGGNLTVSGATTINTGTLTIGNGGTTGSITGNITNNASLAFNRSDNRTHAGAISGTGNLHKLGNGTLTLDGNNTYTGATTVSAGQLNVDGEITSTAIVQSGALIGGEGSIGGLVLNNGATIAPGNSPGRLIITGNATWIDGAHYDWQSYAINTDSAVQTGAGFNWDLVDIGDTLTLSGLSSSNRFNLNLQSLSGTNPDVPGAIPGWNPSVGNTWLIAQATGGINLDGTALAANTNYSDLFNINTSGWFGGGSFDVVTLGSNTALYLQAINSAAIPEPGQVAASILLLAGIGAYAFLKRRKTAKAKTT